MEFVGVLLHKRSIFPMALPYPPGPLAVSRLDRRIPAIPRTQLALLPHVPFQVLISRDTHPPPDPGLLTEVEV